MRHIKTNIEEINGKRCSMSLQLQAMLERIMLRMPLLTVIGLKINDRDRGFGVNQKCTLSISVDGPNPQGHVVCDLGQDRHECGYQGYHNMKFSQRNERRDWISRRRKTPLLFYERRYWISPKRGELSFVSKKETYCLGLSWKHLHEKIQQAQR